MKSCPAQNDGLVGLPLVLPVCGQVYCNKILMGVPEVLFCFLFSERGDDLGFVKTTLNKGGAKWNYIHNYIITM
jgi:hypothetical protein